MTMIRTPTTSSTGVALLLCLGLAPIACMKPNPFAAIAEDSEGSEPDDGAPGPSEPGADEPNGAPGPDPDDPGDPDDPDDPDDPPLDLGPEPSECGPPLATQGACDACLADACCIERDACASDPDCACLIACVLAGKSPGLCKNQCGAKPDDSPTFEPLLDCANGACSAPC
jgi:hypothetical protein